MTIEKIFKENYDSMVRIAAKYCPLYAEDIAVDAFAKFIPLYQENKIHPTKISHWLHVSVKHLAIDFKRKRQVTERMHNKYLAQDFENEILNSADLRLVQRIKEIIAAYRGKTGMILRMSLLDGKSMVQVAYELGSPLKTVCNLRLEAMKRIAKSLNK